MVVHFSDIFKWLTIGFIYTKLEDFVKLGLHFMGMWINSWFSRDVRKN